MSFLLVYEQKLKLFVWVSYQFRAAKHTRTVSDNLPTLYRDDGLCDMCSMF